MLSFRGSDGAHLSYTERGPRGGTPLLLVHGWQTDGTHWGPLIDALGERYRIVAVDLRGSGASRSAPGPYRIQTFANDLFELVAAIDLNTAIAVGHSMGAKVALRFAIDHPEAVLGLVLVAPIPPGPVAYEPRLAAFLRSTAGNPANTSAWLKRLTYREPSVDIANRMREAAATLSEEVALESFDSWTALDFAGEAATLATPVLVIAPAEDNPGTPDFVRERVADVIPGSRMEVVAECGHYLAIEQPAHLARLIGAFVEDLVR